MYYTLHAVPIVYCTHHNGSWGLVHLTLLHWWSVRTPKVLSSISNIQLLWAPMGSSIWLYLALWLHGSLNEDDVQPTTKCRYCTRNLCPPSFQDNPLACAMMQAMMTPMSGSEDHRGLTVWWIFCIDGIADSWFFTLRATLPQESKSSKWSARASAKTFKHQVQDHPHVCHSPETYSATNVLHLNTWTAWFMQLCPLWCHVLIRPRLVNAFLDRFKIPMAKKEMHIRHCSLPASQYKQKYSESLDGTKHIFFRDLTSQLEVGRECMSTQLDRGAVLCGPSGAVAFPHQILGIWSPFWKKKSFCQVLIFSISSLPDPKCFPVHLESNAITWWSIHRCP